MNKELVDIFRSILEAKYEAHLSPEGKKQVRGLRHGGVAGKPDEPSPTTPGQPGSVAALANKPKADRNRDPRVRSFRDTQAMQRYKASRQTASHDPRSEFINRIVNNISETHAGHAGETHARHAAAVQAQGEKKKGARMAARDIIASAQANNPKPTPEPKKEEASTDPKVNFINRTVDNLVERLIGKQKKLDVNNSGDLDSQDFEMLRKGKKKDKRKDEGSDYSSALDKKSDRMSKRTPKVGTPAAGAAAQNLAGAARRAGDKPTAKLALNVSRMQPKPKLP